MFLFEGAIKYLKRKYVIKCIFSFKDFDKSCLLFQTIIPSTFLKKVFQKVIPFYYILKTILNTYEVKVDLIAAILYQELPKASK